jgi:hypothetical protein
MHLLKLLISSTGKHRGMVLYGTDVAWVVWPILNGSLEDYPLVVAFALPLRLDAVSTRRSLFSTLDTAFSTSEAPGLGPLSHLLIC